MINDTNVINDTDVVILDAARTAIGSLGGALSGTPAPELGAAVIRALLQRGNIHPDSVDEVIIGQVLTAGCGQNPARQAAIFSGLTEKVSALTINKVCGSGLKAVELAFQAIRNGDAGVVIAGGQENMSMAPHILPRSRRGVKMGDWVMPDSAIVDGLTDAFHHYHMGITAENVAEQYGISRQEQDEFALRSQQKATEAYAMHAFSSEIIPLDLPVRKTIQIFCKDEFPRPQTTLTALSALQPAFKKDGSVTAGNASGINDGAAMLVLASGKKARELDIRPMGRVVAFASAGVDPSVMGTGPIPASQKVLSKSGWDVQDLDVIEANEAFAAQAIAVNREMKWDTGRVNVNGGAIALGHPVGASGARILVSLLHEMQRQDARRGLATLCIGGGMGIAATIERF